MSTTTNGEVCVGVLLNDEAEEFELPWMAADVDCDEEEWWLKVNGYKPPFELFTEDGDYIGGVEPPRAKVREYYAHKTAWMKLNPLPFELVNYRSGDCPMYILAVPGTVQTANRGYPKELTLDTRIRPLRQIVLREFCKKYNLPTEFKWWLTSYWG